MSALETCQTCGKQVFAGETVTISAAEYRELLARPAPPAAPSAVLAGKPHRGRIANDPELARFPAELAAPGTMILRDMRQAAIRQFGVRRVPSLTVCHRFLQALGRGEVPFPIQPRARGA